MAKTKYRKQSKKQSQDYEKIVEKYRDFILDKQGVVSFGVGFKYVDGQRTDTICLLVYVDNKQEVERKNLIPAKIEGVPTDVIEVEPADEEPLPLSNQVPAVDQVPAPSAEVMAMQQAIPAPSAEVMASVEPLPAPSAEITAADQQPSQEDVRFEHRRYEPIIAGVSIHNPQTGVDHVGALGAIVFDKNTDEPLGLSVAHAIGNQGGHPLDEGKFARIGDPVNQPPQPQDPNNEIGTLLDFDIDFDVAIFKFNDKRRFAPKMKGRHNDEFDVNEPIKARVGMIVECPARSTCATGTVLAIMTDSVPGRQNGRSKYVKSVYIQFDKSSLRTQGGDSGAVWVESKSKRPIGLHRGRQGWRFPHGHSDTVAMATSMQQIVDWHPFRFRPTKASLLRPELSAYETCFVELKSGFVAFCWQPETRSLIIKKFDRNLKSNDELTVDIHPKPKTGVAVARIGDQIHAVWRGPKNRVHCANFATKNLSVDKPKKLKFETLQRPALVSFKNQLVMAYTDADRKLVHVAWSHDGKNWRNSDRFEIANTKTRHGPALLALRDKIILCWVNKSDNRIMLAHLNPAGRSFRVYYRKLRLQTDGIPALASGRGKLFLAYTTLKGTMRVLEGSDPYHWFWSWQTRSTDSSLNKSNPSMLVVDGELICLRPDEVPSSQRATKKNDPTQVGPGAP